MKKQSALLQVRIDPKIKAKLMRLAKKNRISMSEQVRLLVEGA